MKFGETILMFGIFVVLPIIIVAIVARAKTNATNKRAQIALAAIEKNSDVDLEEFFKKMNQPRPSIKERLLDKLLYHPFWCGNLCGSGYVRFSH